nr:hypothetical protein [Tanacetum cinerariifolium]
MECYGCSGGGGVTGGGGWPEAASDIRDKGDVSIFNFSSDDEDDGAMADMNNLDTTIQVIRIPTTRIHKDHSLDQIDDDYQLAERLQAQEQEESSDSEKATLFMKLLEKIRKHFAAKIAEEKRNKPPTQAQQRKIMCTYLKNMEGYTLKQLKSFRFDKIHEMFDKAFRRVNTFEDFITELVEGKEKRAGEELVQESLKKHKVEDDKETAELKQLMEIIMD